MTGKIASTLGFVACAAVAWLACGGDVTDPGSSNGVDTTGGNNPAPFTVLSVTPTNGATGVEPTGQVAVTFSAPVKSSTVTAATFQVGSASGTIAVNGATATFTAGAPLASGTSYTVSVGTAVTDTAGAALAAPFSSSFQTKSAPLASNAGPDVFGTAGGSVTLNGGGSTGNSPSFAWAQIWGPSVGALSGSTPSFTAPVTVTTLGFTLTVSDASRSAGPDTVRVFVLEDGAHAFFVSPTGSDANAGTLDAPKASVQAAIAAADNSGNGGDVYLAGGDYAGSISLKSRVSVYGGFDGTTWERDAAAFASVIQGGPVAVSGSNVTALWLDGLTIQAADAADSGQSSIAILLNDAGQSNQAIHIRHNLIMAGAGYIGKVGAPGGTGAKGEDGGDGEGSGVCGNAGGSGGNSPSGVNAGGSGGAGGAAGGSDGGGGTGSGGNGGSGGGIGGAGSTADSGRVGGVGSAGTAGAAFGGIAPAGYMTADGGSGGTGGKGSGGGGGGGGGGAIIGLCGGGGGGGGAGGLGGTGGKGGHGGGASIGIVLVGATLADILDNTITTGAGGVGGDAGDGGGAGGYGAAGSGGAGGGGGGKGGNGGRGGKGGRGGHGGGGGGGPSIGIVEDVSVSLNADVETRNTFTPGTPGTGGQSGTNGGATGEVGAHKKLT